MFVWLFGVWGDQAPQNRADATGREENPATVPVGTPKQLTRVPRKCPTVSANARRLKISAMGAKRTPTTVLLINYLYVCVCVAILLIYGAPGY